jgi:cytochrome c-type biogenesis protein CcmE
MAEPDFIARFRRLPPKRQRLAFVFLAVMLTAIGLQFVLGAFRQNIIYFYTPSELFSHQKPRNQPIRVGGLVEFGSSKRRPDGTRTFIVTDGAARIGVYYKGQLPALFREGQGVVAEGLFQPDGTLLAERILAKHDEQYMPPEVAARLKQSGYWREPKPGQ